MKFRLIDCNMKLVPTINIDSCVDGCDAEPTHFYLIGESETGVLAATCDKHISRIGMCAWYAKVTGVTREEATILAVLMS